MPILLMKKIPYRQCIAAIMLVILSCSAQKIYKDASPGKNLEVTFSLTKSGQPQCALSAGKTKVLEPSLMGFELTACRK